MMVKLFGNTINPARLTTSVAATTFGSMISNQQHPTFVEWSDEDQCSVGTCTKLLRGCVHGAGKAKVEAELRLVVEEVLAPKGSQPKG
jgi:hypothetical protein